MKALNQSGLGDQVTFMVMGGGASLEFLSGATGCRRSGEPVMGSSHSEYTETDSINFMEKIEGFIAGNWKMNKTVAEALDLVQDLVREVQQVKEVDVVICPAFTALGGL